MTFKNKEKKIWRGSKNLSHSLDFVTKPIFKKRGFTENKILTDWNKIVGDSLGGSSVPKKLFFSRNKKSDGVLYVEVYDSGMAMEMTYMEPIIIEKIASYFGYKAISKLKIIQKPGGGMKPQEKKDLSLKATAAVPDYKRRQLDDLIGGIDDEEMKVALSLLGTSVLSE